MEEAKKTVDDAQKRVAILQSLRADPDLPEEVAKDVNAALSMFTPEIDLASRVSFVVGDEAMRSFAAEWSPGAFVVGDLFPGPFGSMFGPFWNHSGTILGPFWACFLDRSGTMLGLFSDYSGACFLDRAGVDFEPFWEGAGLGLLQLFWDKDPVIPEWPTFVGAARMLVLASQEGNIGHPLLKSTVAFIKGVDLLKDVVF